MDDKPPPFAELFGAALHSLGDAIIQSVDDALLASRGAAQPALPDDDEAARAFASERDDVAVSTARQLARAPDAVNLARAYPSSSPCVDFGRCVERIPGVVLEPRTLAALSAARAFVAGRDRRLAVRGAATTTGGQTLVRDHGDVLDLRRLDEVRYDPDTELVTVGAGATWRHVVAALHGPRRLPPVVPFYPGATVGGTVAVGAGYGESSHRAGLAAEHVVALQLLTDHGDPIDLTPADEAFGAAIGGLGRTGVIASVTLATRPRPRPDVLRVRAGWESVAHFVDDAISLIEDEPDFDLLAVRRTWDDDFPVVGTLGRLPLRGDDTLELDRLGDLDAELGEVSRRSLETALADRWRWLPSETCAPSLTCMLPLPRGLDALKRIEALLEDARLLPAMPRGATLFVVPTCTDARLPHVPRVDTDYGLIVDVRPLVHQHRVRNVLRVLSKIALEVQNADGTVLPTGSSPLFPSA